MNAPHKIEDGEAWNPLPSLTIWNLTSETCIIQWWMGVWISNWRLAGTVSKEWGIGTLSSVWLAGTPEYLPLFREAVRERKAGKNHLDTWELEKVFQEINLRCIREEIRKAREICGNKPLFINIMRAVNGYEDQVRTACEEKINGIVTWAGLPLNLPEITKDFPEVLLFPILSSAKSVGTVLKSWKKFHRNPDGIILEDPSTAGGHLGAVGREIWNIYNPETTLEISIPATQSILDSTNLWHIPIIAAGWIVSRKDIDKMLSLWASGVQMGTRFLASVESNASVEFKTAIVRANVDTIITYMSNAGMPARALEESPALSEGVDIRGEIAPWHPCDINCLMKCGYRDGTLGSAQICIFNRLTAAVENSKGKNPLFFTGTSATEIDTILSVHDILEGLRK